MINLKNFVKKNSGNISFLLLSLVSILLLVNQSSLFCEKLERGGYSFFSVFQLGLSGIKSVFAGSLKSIGEVKRLRIENEDLNNKLHDYLKVKNENVELINENLKLKEQLKLRESINSIYASDVRQISAEVIAKQPGNFFSSIVINKGRADGLRPKMAVVSVYENYLGLVGKTLTVGEHTAIVMPLYNSAFFIAARFQSSYYEGLVSGAGENSRNLLMRYVPKQAKSEIKFGEFIITSGMSQIYPKGIHIGTVKTIQSKTYDTSMEVEIDPVIDFSKLEYVIILENRVNNE